jgi:iron(III) transport system substrate-binding protein
LICERSNRHNARHVIMVFKRSLPVKRLNLLLILAAIAMLLAACGATASNLPAAEASPAAEEEPAPALPALETTAEPGSAGRLVIYSGRSESLVGPLIERFEAETGIDVDVRYGSTSEMAGVLLEEGDASPADVFYTQDPGGLGAVQAAGLLAALPEETLARTPARFRASDGTWAGVSGRARVAVYDTGAIPDPAAELPADIYDFIDPAWDGRIGWAPTNGSFQAMVTAMRQMWGEEKTRAWLEGMQANNPRVYDGNSPIVEAVANGEVEVGLVNHYYLYRFLAEQGESFGARNYFLPGGGPGSLLMVSGAGVLAGADNGDNARRFVDYLLSPAAQEYFVTETAEYPVVDGIDIPASLPPLEELDAIAPDIALADLADLQGTQDLLIELGIIE